jgi:hypothetical protein
MVTLLCHSTRLEPENSSTYQCHAHDNYNLILLAGEYIPGRLHHPPSSLHIHIHPRRNPQKRLDRSKNFAAHDAEPHTKFVFDSHWLSRSIRWNYIWARKPLADPAGSIQMPLQWKCVAHGEGKVLVARFQVGSNRGLLQMGTPPATVLRCRGSGLLLNSQEEACCRGCRCS